MDASGLTYPSRLARALFVALEHTAGPSALAGALEATGLARYYGGTPGPDEPGLDFVEVSAFVAELETLYGTRGGRGIALKMGTTVFENGLQDYGIMLGVTAPEFERLPVNAQAHISLMGLAAVFSHISDQASEVKELETTFHFVVNPSPFAWGRTSDKPVCHVLVGVLQACLRWATRGYEFAVYETACRAVDGEACVFQVSKQPIGRI